MNGNRILRMLAIITISLALSAFPGINPYFRIASVRGNTAPLPGSPGAQWTPAGPSVDKLQIQIYASGFAECNDLVAGKLDLTDTPLTGYAACSNLSGAGSGFYVTGSNYVYRFGWQNVIDASPGYTGLGGVSASGIPNFFSLLNARSPNPTLDVNGNSVLRWGFSSGTSHLNPYSASFTSQDYLVLREVYDTLTESNPNAPTNLFGWMANQYAVLAPQPGDPPGTVQDLKVSLRPDVLWHDGVQVTAQDIKFSLLTLKAQFVAAGALLGACLFPNLIDVTVLSNFLFQINWAAPVSILCIQSLPMLPQHIWASNPTLPCTVKSSAPCTVNPALLVGAAADPVVNHRMIGSGPFMCVDLANGPIGGGCTTPFGGAPGSGTQATGPGDTILLQRYATSAFFNGLPNPTGGGQDSYAYFRTPAKYLAWQWADKFGHGTGDILDLSSAEGCTNLAANTPGCAHWDTAAATITTSILAGSTTVSSFVSFGGNGDGTVNTIEVAQAASWFGISWTSPVAYVINHSTGATTVPVDAQPIPQTIYEGGVTYVAETIP